jgi:hypothetical protein
MERPGDVPDWADDPWNPPYSIRGIEEDRTDPGNFQAWGFDCLYNTALHLYWDGVRQAYVEISGNPRFDISDIYIFNFTDDDNISGCFYFQTQ